MLKPLIISPAELHPVLALVSSPHHPIVHTSLGCWSVIGGGGGFDFAEGVKGTCWRGTVLPEVVAMASDQMLPAKESQGSLVLGNVNPFFLVLPSETILPPAFHDSSLVFEDIGHVSLQSSLLLLNISILPVFTCRPFSLGYFLLDPLQFVHVFLQMRCSELDSGF